MIIECFAITTLILAIFFIYIRLKRTKMALTILPLIGVPTVHILAFLLLSRMASFLPVEGTTIVTVLDVAAMATSSLFCGAMSRNYEKRFRITYLVIAGLFNAVLTCILLANL